jgi:acetyl esterase/lipase
MIPVRRLLSLTASFFLVASVSDAQSFTRTLWPAAIPGRIAQPTYRPLTEFVDHGTIRLTRVVEPTVECFLLPRSTHASPAVIICPGGGYARLADDHEGTQIALWLNSIGVSAIILRYRMPSDSTMLEKSIGPLQDVQEAVRTVRRHAAEWGVDPTRIGILGFSAGGHLASSASTRYAENVYVSSDSTSARPDFSILVYPVITMDISFGHGGSRANLLGSHPTDDQVRRASNELRVTSDTPPAFLVHAADDDDVSPLNSIRYFEALKAHGVPAELHVYARGGHGFGLARSGGTESGWPEACTKWMSVRKILDRK